jgi:hypothetical protein
VKRSHSHDQKKNAAARRLAADERRHLRAELVGVLASLGTLVPKESGIQAAQASTSVGSFVQYLATALEGADGTETRGQVEVLGALSDLAQMRMTAAERAAPLETPSQILRWFALYLERTLDKPDLRLS